MLQELAARTGAAPWVIGSTLFFIGVWLVIAIWVITMRREDADARAHLALEGDDDAAVDDVGKPVLPGRRDA